MASPQIPLRNIWLLFLYAADLARFKEQLSVEAESASDLPELVARLFCASGAAAAASQFEPWLPS